MRTFLISILTALTVVGVTVPMKAKADTPVVMKRNTVVLDIRKNFNGARVPGRSDINIVGNNPFRQTRSVAVTPQSLAPPDLSFLLGGASAPKSATDAAASTKAGAGTGCDEYSEQNFKEKGGLDKCVSHLAKDFDALQASINNSVGDDRALATTEDSILYQDFKNGITDDNLLSQYTDTVRVCLLGETKANAPLALGCPAGAVSVVAANKRIQQWQTNYNNLQKNYSKVNAHAPAKVPAALQAIKSSMSDDSALMSSLLAYRDTVLSPMLGGSTDPFIYESQQSCNLLSNGGRTNKIVVSVSSAAVPGQAPAASSGAAAPSTAKSDSAATGTQTYDVTAVCQPPVFVSIGLGADTIHNYTYSNVPPNTAGLPAPAPSATPMPSTIAQGNTGARVVAFTMANYSPWEDVDGSGFSLSLGLGLPLSNPNGVKPDILGGFSYSIRRTVVLTLGMAYGSATTLAPGYSAGGPILAGLTPPTVSNYTTGYFFAISFGK
jgi:hypothetical protein